MFRKSLFASFAILLVAVIAGTFVFAQQESQSTQPSQIKTSEGGQQDKLHELLTQRRDTLAKRVEVLESRRMRGVVLNDLVVEARDELLKAELQLVEVKDQRIAILQKRIDNLSHLEDSAKARRQHGTGTLESMLSA